MVNIRSKLVKLIGVTLSTCCVASSFHLEAAPKFKYEDVSKEFKKFLCSELMHNVQGLPSNFDLKNYVENIVSANSEIYELFADLAKQLTNLVNFAYYASLLPECLSFEPDEKYKEAYVFGVDVRELANKMGEPDELGGKKLCDPVQFNSLNFDEFAKDIDAFFENMNNSLASDKWAEWCDDFTDNVFENWPLSFMNLLFVTKDIMESGKYVKVFGNEGVLKDIFSKYTHYENIANHFDDEYDIFIQNPENSSIVKFLRLSHEGFETKAKQGRTNCPQCALGKKIKKQDDGTLTFKYPKEGKVPFEIDLKTGDNYTGNGEKLYFMNPEVEMCKKCGEGFVDSKNFKNAILKIFNCVLSKIYNDYLTLLRRLFGEGAKMSLAHRLIPTPLKEKNKGNMARFYRIGIKLLDN